MILSWVRRLLCRHDDLLHVGDGRMYQPFQCCGHHVNLDVATFASLCALLAAPDPDVPSPARPGAHRGSRVTQPGDKNRRQTVMVRLLTAWLQTRYLALDPEPSIGADVQVRPFLVRRRA